MVSTHATATFVLAGAMISALSAVTAQSPDQQAAAKHPAGIYIVDSGAGSSENLVRIVGARPQEMKTTGMGKMMLTGGLLKGAMVVVLAGPTADVRVAAASPTFYFYFDSAPASPSADPMAAFSQMMGGDAMPPGAKTAADFTLVRLSLTNEGRQANLGKVGASGSKPKDSVACVQERLAQGAYRLRPKEPLQPGEYAFFFGNSMGPAAGGMTAWDFGVDAAK